MQNLTVFIHLYPGKSSKNVLLRPNYLFSFIILHTHPIITEKSRKMYFWLKSDKSACFLILSCTHTSNYHCKKSRKMYFWLKSEKTICFLVLSCTHTSNYHYKKSRKRCFWLISDKTTCSFMLSCTHTSINKSPKNVKYIQFSPVFLLL